jgi:hypothetical protein
VGILGRDHIVAALGSLIATPGVEISGVEIHLDVIASLSSSSFPRHPVFSPSCYEASVEDREG